MTKLLALALVVVSTATFATPPTTPLLTQQQTSNSTSASDATNAGNQQTIVFEANDGSSAATIGAAAARDVANIQAAAAIRIAEIQAAASAAGRDLTIEQRAALDREAAIKIEQIRADTARAVAATTQKIRNTPSVNGPPLVSSNDTCMGSASAAINAPGIGVALGKTYTDDNCVMLKNSRELWNMGMKAASLALMCNDRNNREALELTGFECPQTTRDRKAGQAPAAAAPVAQYTDPIVRARLGLPPLK